MNGFNQNVQFPFNTVQQVESDRNRKADIRQELHPHVHILSPFYEKSRFSSGFSILKLDFVDVPFDDACLFLLDKCSS